MTMAWGAPESTGGVTGAQAAAIARVPNNIHGNWFSNTAIPLTTTLTKVATWTVSTVSSQAGVSESSGDFTFSDSAGVKFTLERSYANSDTNPTVAVNATIELRKNGVAFFTNTRPIPPATNPGGDGTISITDSFLVDVSADDVIDIYVSGEDNAANPDDARLTKMNMVVTPAYA